MEVFACRLIDGQLRTLGEFLSAINGLLEDPPAGSAARVDYDYIQRHPQVVDMIGLRWWAARSVALNATAAEEHLKGVRALLALTDDLLPLPAMALARSVYEAVVQTCWLIDVEVSTKQRLARWAARLLHDTQEVPSALEAFGSAAAEREIAGTVEGRELGQRLMSRAGFELRAKGGDRSDETRLVIYQGEESSLTPNITTNVDRYTPGQTYLWPLFSGATHSRGWLVSGLQGGVTEMYASILAPLMDTSDAFVVELSRYFGLDTRPIVTKTHQQRSILMRRTRPSQSAMRGVDGWRAAMGSWPLPKTNQE